MGRVTVTIDQAGIDSMIRPGGVLYRHIDRTGSAVSTVAKLTVGVDTGRLRQSIGHRVIVRKTQCTARISARPKYAKVHHDGRGPVVAKPGGVLRIELPGGQVIYRKRVGPAAGNPFLTDAVKTVTGKTPRRRDALSGGGD